MKLTTKQNKALYITLKLISLITFVVMVFLALLVVQCGRYGYYSYSNAPVKYEDLHTTKSYIYSNAIGVINAYQNDYLENPVEFTSPNYTYELYYNPRNLEEYDDFLPSSSSSAPNSEGTDMTLQETSEPASEAQSQPSQPQGDFGDMPEIIPPNDTDVTEPVYPQLILSTFNSDGDYIEYRHKSGDYLVISRLKQPITEGDRFGYSQKFYTQFYNISLNMAYSLICFVVLQIILVLATLRMAYKHYEPMTLRDDNKFPHVNIPLEFYLALFCLAAFFVSIISFESTYYYESDDLLAFIPLVIMGVGYVGCLEVLIGFVRALKLPRWWRNTVIYKLYSFFAGIWHIVKEIFRHISVTWKFALAFCLLTFINFLCANSYFSYYSGFAFLFGFVLNCVVLVGVCYVGVMLNRLKIGAEHIATGDVNHKIDTRKMYDVFKTHADNLNNIAGGISAAVAKEMKSERLKTELITNVSHDIKTPLTSIINYANLLETQELGEQGREYLEVVLRSSERLKKLTEDLVDASKASTKNMSVEYSTVDLPELITQSLGEYSEKFENKNLEVIFEENENTPPAYADGRHMWRILDNVFSNIYKYALSGTRVYIDIRETHASGMEIVVKNTSQDRLNIDESELIERFVRGDSSRTTEGSGLGLSIARSLCELMGGSFGIEIDGDLFKVIIALKKAEM